MSTINIRGKTLGSCVIGDYLVLFTKASDCDRIYKLKKPNESTMVSNGIELFCGDLNFSLNNTIQTLPFYENETTQKVYWIDGVNQPRVINIADESYKAYNSTMFDFVKTLQLNELVSVSKSYGSGYFKSGVIQYAMTYYDKSGSESNIFWISDINYISNDDVAGKPDEIIRNSFTIKASSLDKRFEYARIYAIYRTALNSTPEVRVVSDIALSKSVDIKYTDSGLSGSIVSPDILLYVGGEELIPGCISQKNNTLFLGNIKLKNGYSLPSRLKNIDGSSPAEIPAHNSTFNWISKSKELENSISNGSSYPYRPFKSNIKHFKFDETYRLGIQGQFENGKWSTPMWLGNDIRVDKRYSTIDNSNGTISVSYINGVYNVDNALKAWMIAEDGPKFKIVRPVMVPLDYSDRTIIAQGLVSNTLGVVKNRYNGKSTSPFAYPDYMFRTGGKTKTTYSSIYAYDGSYSHFDILKLNNNLRSISTGSQSNTNPGLAPNEYIEVMANCDSWDYYNLYHNGVSPSNSSGVGILNNDYDRDFLFVDRNMVNFWSPELINNQDILNSYVKNTSSVGLYGFAIQTGLSSKFEIDFGDKDDSLGSDPLNFSIQNYEYAENFNLIQKRRLFPLFQGSPTDGSNRTHKSWMNIPIWSPQRYKIHLPDRNGGSAGFDAENTDIDFTRMYKSGFNYFGINNNLKDSESFKYDINNPSLIVNDGNVFYKSNDVDNLTNGGNVIYSKNVEKNYPTGSYYNTIRYRDSADNGRRVLIYTGNFPNDRDEEVNFGMSLKYNTATHALFSFKKSGSRYACMPRVANTGDVVTSELFDNTPWYRGGSDGFKIDVIPKSKFKNTFLYSSTKNVVPLMDLYSSIINDPSNPGYNKYGGLSDSALYGNTWIPCGPSVKITDAPLSIEFTDGDTYIGRFDMLRVFPNDILQIPQHTEIVSFICESFINSDGRSDVNRYNTDSSLMTPSNYGLFNNVYSQPNNYFAYNILDSELFKSDDFPNTIVWSKTKLSGEKIDTWTNVNMLSSIDLDGVNGPISSLNLFNSEMYAFQDNAIARLLYNERIQQQASDGVSVELANGYKVPEYRYLTNQYGCSNRNSIVEGKQGIYFIDYKNKSFNLLSNGIKDLSLSGGMRSWFSNNVVGKNYYLSYDKANYDVYIHDETNCLNYSEQLNTFESFFDYTDVIQMRNIWDRFMSIRNDEPNDISAIWIHNVGDYNKFYGTNKSFGIEYLMNPDPQIDKIFNTVDYRVDNINIDWNTLSLNNWYQEASICDGLLRSILKRKFNVNRVTLPRQKNSMNRIRSTWMKLKLEYIPKPTQNNNNKFEMQDLTINYTI